MKEIFDILMAFSPVVTMFAIILWMLYKLTSNINRFHSRFLNLEKEVYEMKPQLEKRFEKIDERFEKLETKFDDRFEKMDAKFDKLTFILLDEKVKLRKTD